MDAKKSVRSVLHSKPKKVQEKVPIFLFSLHPKNCFSRRTRFFSLTKLMATYYKTKRRETSVNCIK